MHVRFGTRVIAEKQLNAYINSSIKMMRSMGLVKGERVALYDSNSVEYALLLICFWYMRVVACPINPKISFKNAHEYAAKLGCKHFFTRTEIKKAIAFDARQQLYAQALPELDQQQDAVIIATSGSLGEPKAVVLTIGNLLNSAKGSKTVIPFESTDGWLLALPLYHVSGVSIVMRALEANASLVVATSDQLSDDLKRSAVTHVSLVLTQLYRLLKDEEAIKRLKELKAILLGGSAIPKQLLAQTVVLGLPIYISYGLTEMASQVATGKVINPDIPCAKVLDYRELMIAPDGEILVKGETLAKGYVVGQRVELRTDDKGWFHTGDMGSLSQDGCLSVLGRRDNMFICAGENIFPEEIERELLKVELVKQAIVVPKVDPEYGFKPVAFIDVVGDINFDQLNMHCRSVLPTIKVPVEFHPWPKFVQQGIKLNRKDFQIFLDTNP